MQIQGSYHWGFLLEHENVLFFIPVRPQTPLVVSQQIKIAEDFVVVVTPGQHPFTVNSSRQVTMLEKDSPYAELAMREILRHVGVKL
jgi:hypothetical protein